MIEVPPDALSADALRGLIEEFVSRHGTDLAEVGDKVQQVRRQLASGRVIIVFDEQSQTCNIMSKDAAEKAQNAEQERRVECDDNG